MHTSGTMADHHRGLRRSPCGPSSLRDESVDGSTHTPPTSAECLIMYASVGVSQPNPVHNTTLGGSGWDGGAAAWMIACLPVRAACPCRLPVVGGFCGGCAASRAKAPA